MPHRAFSIVSLIGLLMVACGSPSPDATPTPAAEQSPAPNTTADAPATGPTQNVPVMTVAPPVDDSGGVVYGYTHHRADGNKFVAGSTNLPGATVVDVQLRSEPVWLTVATFGDATIWTIVLADGTMQAFRVTDANAEEISVFGGKYREGWAAYSSC